jgi:hypothetical protein
MNKDTEIIEQAFAQMDESLSKLEFTLKELQLRIDGLLARQAERLNPAPVRQPENIMVLEPGWDRETEMRQLRRDL